MITGYLNRSHKIRPLGEKRVGKVLKEINPRNYNRRCTNTARIQNPIPYRADYFGHKLHVDQNEKLVMYGLTHVIAIDGHSRFIVAHSLMPIKNNLTIYEEVYRYSIMVFFYLPQFF